MDPNTFKRLTEDLLHYNKSQDRFYTKPQTKTCEHCGEEAVKDQLIVTQVYYPNSKKRFVATKCFPCERVLKTSEIPKDQRIPQKRGPKPKSKVTLPEGDWVLTVDNSRNPRTPYK